MKKIIILSLIILMANITFSQISQRGYPYTYSETTKNLFRSVKLKSGSVSGNYTLPYVSNIDEMQYVKALKNNCSDCRNEYYGKGLDVNLNFKSRAYKPLTNDGLNVWILKFESNEAFGMQFVFDDFQIPEGAQLFFYNEERTFLLGAFTQENNMPNRRFTTQYIKGSTIIMEYIEPENAEYEGSLNISHIVHVFKDVFNRSGPFTGIGDGAAECEIDAVCHSFDWDKEIRSVALILRQGQDGYFGWCSGALINKVNNYQDSDNPYFLTANHCLYEDGTYIGDEIDDWVFLFNYQQPICGTDLINDPTDEELQEMMTQSVTGAEIISRDVNQNLSDFLLLKFKGNNTVEKLKEYRVCYAGWENNNIGSSIQFAGIHHPSGDVKKISLSSRGVQSSSYEDGTGPTYYWRLIWDQGVTEGGSSGSPLFSSQHRIIGQLKGGTSFCETTYWPDGSFRGDSVSPDWYGKFSTSWEIGNFYQFLDPFNNNDYVDTYEPTGTPPPPASCNNNGMCEYELGETRFNCPIDCSPGCTISIDDGVLIGGVQKA